MKEKVQITKTFVIMLVIGAIVCGIENVAMYDEQFINPKSLGFAAIGGLAYLLFTWANTRKNQSKRVIIAIAVSMFACFVVLELFTTTNYAVKDNEAATHIMPIIRYIYYGVIWRTAKRQSSAII